MLNTPTFNQRLMSCLIMDATKLVKIHFWMMA